MKDTPLGKEFFSVATENIKRIWKWNFERINLQKALGDDIFVPKMSYIKVEDQAKTYIAWGDAIATVIPTIVDYVLCYRVKLAHRSWFSKQNDTALVQLKDIEPIMKDYKMVNSPINYCRLDYGYTIPRRIEQFVKTMPSEILKPNSLLSIDHILDGDLVKKYLRLVNTKIIKQT